MDLKHPTARAIAYVFTLHLPSGRLEDALSKASYNKTIYLEKDKLKYISVGTVRMFRTNAKHELG